MTSKDRVYRYLLGLSAGTTLAALVDGMMTANLLQVGAMVIGFTLTTTIALTA